MIQKRGKQNRNKINLKPINILERKIEHKIRRRVCVEWKKDKMPKIKEKKNQTLNGENGEDTIFISLSEEKKKWCLSLRKNIKNSVEKLFTSKCI